MNYEQIDRTNIKQSLTRNFNCDFSQGPNCNARLVYISRTSRWILTISEDDFTNNDLNTIILAFRDNRPNYDIIVKRGQIWKKKTQ